MLFIILGALALATFVYFNYRYHSSLEKVNDFQDNPPVMWDEIEYNPN